jgi:hypothetical protein
MAKITYHKTHSFIGRDGSQHQFTTQLYKTGVYGIMDNDSSMQVSFTPQKVKSIEKKLQKGVDSGELKSFELGVPITVTDASGLWEEIEEK